MILPILLVGDDKRCLPWGKINKIAMGTLKTRPAAVRPRTAGSLRSILQKATLPSRSSARARKFAVNAADLRPLISASQHLTQLGSRFSLVVCPHSNDFDGTFNAVHLINQAVLNIDAPRKRAGEIAHQLPVRRRSLKRIPGQYFQQAFHLRSETGCADLFRVFLCLSGVNNRPAHHPGFLDAFRSGSANPFRIDCRIPGMERRWSVS